MKTLLSFYNLKLPKYFVFMLQQVEYEPSKFLDWIERLIKSNKKIGTVVYRKSLVSTNKAKSLIYFLYFFSVLLLLLVGIISFRSTSLLLVNYFVILLALPYFLIIALAIITFFSRIFIVIPKQSKLIKSGNIIFSKHDGVKIAVVGSYGKTTMKELLDTILSEGLNVAVTPGNMNTPVSHARFAQKLSGKEDVIIVEFGEGEPGDVISMASTLKPDFAIITGLAPNHLDKYSSLEEVAEDLLSVHGYTKKNQVFVTDESVMLKPFITREMQVFSITDVMGWQISEIEVSVSGTSFVMKKGTKQFDISTGLLGRHQVAPVAFGAALADKLGLSKEQIETGCMKIFPFEHRMQPRLIHGAWLIDDTYNGNLEGLQAGLQLLKELDMKRKWYVTPGLVDQGVENERVHNELGKSIAEADPDIVILMENSARPIIEKAMKVNKFKGELRIETDPLLFYTNLEHVIVPGDLVIMQNDWTDNYN